MNLTFDISVLVATTDLIDFHVHPWKQEAPGESEVVICEDDDPDLAGYGVYGRLKGQEDIWVADYEKHQRAEAESLAALLNEALGGEVKVARVQEEPILDLRAEIAAIWARLYQDQTGEAMEMAVMLTTEWQRRVALHELRQESDECEHCFEEEATCYVSYDGVVEPDYTQDTGNKFYYWDGNCCPACVEKIKLLANTFPATFGMQVHAFDNADTPVFKLGVQAYWEG